jgi:hypothetical protein
LCGVSRFLRGFLGSLRTAEVGFFEVLSRFRESLAWNWSLLCLEASRRFKVSMVLRLETLELQQPSTKFRVTFKSPSRLRLTFKTSA